MDIIDFPNYTIDRDGTVKNKTNDRILKHDLIRNGYKCVRLCENSKVKKFLIHRLLAIHFIPNPENKPFVDHIDRNRLNNDLSNLRWVDASDNQINKTTIGPDHHITWREETQSYQVRFQRYRVFINGGYHKTIEEARAIRDQMMKTE